MEQKNDQSGSEEKERYASSEEISRSWDRVDLDEESVELKNMISEMKRLQSSFDKFRRAYNDKKYCDTTRNQKKLEKGEPISYINNYKRSSEEERSKKIVVPETYGSESFAEKLKEIQMKIETSENRDIGLDDSHETSEEESNETSEENSDKPHGYGHETERKRNRRH